MTPYPASPATTALTRGGPLAIPLPSSMAARTGATRTHRPQLVLLKAFSAIETCVVYGIRDLDGTVDVGVESTPRPGAHHSRALQRELFDTAYDIAVRGGLDIYVSNPQVAGWIARRSWAYPLSKVHHRCPENMRVLVARTAGRRKAVISELRDRYRERRSASWVADGARRVIASDASCVPQLPGAGIACIGADGSATARYLPEVDNIEVAELEAIHLAVASAPVGSLLVLSDNATAVDRAAEAIRGLPIRDDRRGADVLHRIAALSAARTIEVSWVRGHDGQPLNGAADGLARQVRHTAQALPTPPIERPAVPPSRPGEALMTVDTAIPCT